MAPWTAFSHSGDYPFDASSVKKQWRSLHAGDLEPLPDDDAVLTAWALFHCGEFEKAAELIAAGEEAAEKLMPEIHAAVKVMLHSDVVSKTYGIEK